jgi:hypothetical protein
MVGERVLVKEITADCARVKQGRWIWYWKTGANRTTGYLWRPFFFAVKF